VSCVQEGLAERKTKGNEKAAAKEKAKA